LHSNHPGVWLQKAKDAGFTYVVLTTKHHEGFALWPTKYGEFSTRNFMNSRDLLTDYVNAARKVGLKVGFYYSGPDWYFDKDYMNFLLGIGPMADGNLAPEAYENMEKLGHWMQTHGEAIDYTYRDGMVTVQVPGSRSQGVLSVIKITVIP